MIAALLGWISGLLGFLLIALNGMLIGGQVAGVATELVPPVDETPIVAFTPPPVQPDPSPQPIIEPTPVEPPIIEDPPKWWKWCRFIPQPDWELTRCRPPIDF